jgi:hypothetical protein
MLLSVPGDADGVDQHALKPTGALTEALRYVNQFLAQRRATSGGAYRSAPRIKLSFCNLYQQASLTRSGVNDETSRF